MLPLDNDASEGSLRRVALGCKNYLFVGHVEATRHRQAVPARCDVRGARHQPINPFAYLADVIPRVQDHPKRRLDELPPASGVASLRFMSR